MSTDFELFKGKDLSDVFKDIYDNQQSRKKNISQLIQEIRHSIRSVGDWAVMGPIVKDLIDTSVKNDDSLIKLAISSFIDRVFFCLSLLILKFIVL